MDPLFPTLAMIQLFRLYPDVMPSGGSEIQSLSSACIKS